MSAHTPGPWEVNTLSGRVPIVREVKMSHGEASTYKATIRTSDGGHVCRLDFGYGKPVDAANARLIAAAPDLYEALKVLLTDSPDNGFTRLTLENARRAHAAIAKAEGKA